MALTQEQMDLLSRCFLFADIPADELPGLFAGLSAVEYPAGAVIYSRTQFRKAVGVVLSGRLSAVKGKDILLNTLGPGGCFGVAALFCPAEDYVTTVRAKEPSKLVFLSDQWLTGLFRSYPQAAVSYIAFLSQRIRFLNRKIDSFTAPSAQESLFYHLVGTARDGKAEVVGGYSQLARTLNMGRASLYRALDALETEGRIRREGKIVYLLSDGDSPPERIEGSEVNPKKEYENL